MTTEVPSFGFLIWSARIRKDLSQADLGTLIGSSIKSVSDWESQGVAATDDRCVALSEVLDIPLDLLLASRDVLRESNRMPFRTTRKYGFCSVCGTGGYFGKRKTCSEDCHREALSKAGKARPVANREAPIRRYGHDWAGDYRNACQQADRGIERQQLLSAQWGLSDFGAAGRIEKLFKLGYLQPEDRPRRGKKWSVCKRGHPFTEENSLPSGPWRRCRICRDMMTRQRDQRLREERRRNPKLPKPTGRQMTAFGETKNLKEWTSDDRCAVSYATLISRLKDGQGLEEALTTRQRRGRLLAAEVQEIRRLRREGNTFRSIADKFEVSEATVILVFYNRVWTDPEYCPPLAYEFVHIDLDEIARVYLSASRNPVRAVQHHFGITYKSAQQRVTRARKRGFLPREVFEVFEVY